MEAKDQVVIDLSSIEYDLQLIICQQIPNSLFYCEDAASHGESSNQLKEGCCYDYELTKENYSLRGVCVQPIGRRPYLGTISPNINVGTLRLEVIRDNEFTGYCFVEVQSVKSDYRTDYRTMIDNITERCTELIMQIDSPVIQHFEVDFEADNNTIYQRFCFVKSLIDSREFDDAIQKIVSNPTTRWESRNDQKDIRSVRKFGRKEVQQIASKSNRVELPSDHYMRQAYGIHSLPTSIENSRKRESIDTAENRFVKYALQEFLFFCERCFEKFGKYERSQLEAKLVVDKLSNLLNQSFFKEISRPQSLKLNSPVLQRKSGYREVLNAWMKYDLAAKLVWNGGDDVYHAGKKDIATLYEYWLFFTLLDIMQDVFSIQAKELHQLIKVDNEKLSLTIKQGRFIALKGIYESANRKLNIQFSYNRSFGGGRKFPHGGSYTTTLRPDYTLSIWPEEIKNQTDAELQELITHIHFDAKYKVRNFFDLIVTSKDESLTEQESDDLYRDEIEEEKQGNYKNQDLLKMHAYKDAIRRTGGAYVLYPGEGTNEPLRGFHELIPGLGAFVVKPSSKDDGVGALRKFILRVLDNFIDRSSQRENLATKVYEIHKNEKLDDDVLNCPMPEYINNQRLIPDDTTVLVGYYKHKEQLDWILKNKLYNFRTGTGYGSLSFGKELGAKILLLHGDGEVITNRLYSLSAKGPRLFSANDLKKKKYPSEPTGEHYLMFELEEDISGEFGSSLFDLRKAEKYTSCRGSAKPFFVSLKEMMRELKVE